MAQWQQMQQYGYDQNAWGRGYGAQSAAAYPSYGYGASQPPYGGASSVGSEGQRRERSQPCNTLWVGNLTPAIREEDVRRAFEVYGTIDNIRMLDSKNCAFVTYTTLEAAKAAHASTYGLKINGAEVKINWGRPTVTRDRPTQGGHDHYGQGAPYGGGYPPYGYGGGGYGGGYGGDRPPPPHGDRRDEHLTPSPNIWIGNVDASVPEHELRAAFDRFGPIERVKMYPQKNCAFINFVDLNSALAAKAEMHGINFFGQQLKVNFGKPRTNAPSSGNGHGEYRDSGRRHDRRDDGYHGPSSSGGTSGGAGGSGAPSGPRDDSRSPQQAEVAPSIPLTEPTDVSEEIKSVADKLVEAFEGNPALEATTKQNQANNPKFAFLFPGREGHNYYLWKRYGSKMATQTVQETPSTSTATTETPFVPKLPENAEPLTSNELEDFEGILRNLDPSKERITAGAEFVTKNAGKAPAIANAFYDYVFNKLQPTQNRLHFIFLVNEIFNTILRARVEGVPDTDAVFTIASPFVSHLARLMNLANQEENSKMLVDILNRWKESKVLSPEETYGLEADFHGSDSKKRKREESDVSEETATKKVSYEGAE